MNENGKFKSDVKEVHTNKKLSLTARTSILILYVSYSQESCS